MVSIINSSSISIEKYLLLLCSNKCFLFLLKITIFISLLADKQCLYHPLHFLNLLYIQRARSTDDRQTLMQIAANVFDIEFDQVCFTFAF